MFYAAQRAVMRQVKWMHYGGYFVVAGFPLFMIGLSLIYGGTVLGALRHNAIMIIGLPLFWLFVIPALTKWTAARTLRNTPAFQGELAYTFDEKGVDMRAAVASTQLSWSAFIRAVENKEFVLLFQNKAMATFIPRAAFTNERDLHQFRALINQHLAERAELQREIGSPTT